MPRTPPTSDAAQDFVPGPDTDLAYREALGCFGTGVTVITTTTPDGPLAMTANSFASVSLDPALVLWCPAKSSARYPAFIAAQRYVIHIMAEDQQELAQHFARSGKDFGPVNWHAGPDGLPILPDCLARFECAQSAIYDGGDHSMILGMVKRAWHRPGLGLLFKRGTYGGFEPRG